MRVFISYSTKDLRLVRALSKILTREDITVYVAYFDIKPGAHLWKKIEENIKQSSCLIAVLTKHGSRSEIVNQEIATANAVGIPVIPIVEKNVLLKGLLAGREYIEFDKENPAFAYRKLGEYLKGIKTLKFSRKLSVGLSKWLEDALPFDDSFVRYTVELENDAGDVWIERECSFINSSRSPVTEREHKAFSTDTPVIKFKDLWLKAWDVRGNLPVKKVMDAPTFKRFLIKFPQKVHPGKRYTYSYRYFWPEFLRKKNELFVAEDVSPIIEFLLTSSNKVKRGLKKVLCKEIWNDGRNVRCKILSRKTIAERKFLTKIGKAERFNKVEFLLVFKE